jgi:hypothetical protein
MGERDDSCLGEARRDKIPLSSLYFSFSLLFLFFSLFSLKERKIYQYSLAELATHIPVVGCSHVCLFH